MYGQKLTKFQRFMQRFQLTPIQVVAGELRDAELAHLQSVSMAEYADLRMQTHKLTADYHDARADRLRQYLQDHDPEAQDAEGSSFSLIEAMGMIPDEANI